jgi:hypothetical protein
MDPSPVDSVDCPTCGEAVPVSLPRSATALTVTAASDPELDDAEATDRRRRRLTYSCPAGHAVYVYFEW